MPKCPILVHALVTDSHSGIPLYKVAEPNSGYKGIDCLESDCQVWNEENKDCGLKQSPSSHKQDKIPKNWNDVEDCPATIPEKDWDEQMNNQPDFHPVDCPPQFPSEPE